MDEFVRKLYYGMIILGFALILICGYCTMDGSEEKSLTERTPIKMEQISDAVQNYYFDMSDMTVYGIDVAFFSHHQFIRVFADDEEIYTQTKGGGIWGKTPGSMWNVVGIPYGTEELRIEVDAAYPSVQYEEHKFYFGESLEMYKSILKSSLVSMLVSFVLVIVGATMVIYGTLANRRVYVGRSLVYLGIFITIFGLWSFNETDGATILFNHRITSAFSAFIFLMTMSASFLLFVREFMSIEESFVWKIICFLSVINYVVCLGLQFAGIMDLKETVLVTHIIMLISILYVILALVQKVIKKQITHNLKNNLIALIVLIIAALVDMAFYYLGVMDGDLLGRFIFLLFAIILGREATSNSMKILERGRKAQIYEELAITDSLTHLYNRNCYEMDEQEMEKRNGVLVIAFDLNDLKKCNDTLGHSEGDKYIKAAANMIETVFSEYGKCYRIGGDEFQVLIEKGRTCPIEDLLTQLYREEERYNGSGARFLIHIAAGYALYDTEKDSTIKNACSRADEMMYANKRQYKKRQST
ncbi:MAG: diguanylate cyclase [Lachnospiraceae bacterium]|nr:diguanylate cyclase [Lachnospiraceae bacterium]